MEKEFKPVANINMTTVEYKIGNINVRLKSKFDLSAMPLYTSFIVNMISGIPNITIEIKQISVFCIKNIYKKINEELDNDCTYTWIVKDNGYYMIFSKRFQKLLKAEWEDIWILYCNDKFSECVLYIPYAENDSKILYEMSVRPWLQRLFVAFSCKLDFVLLHGALIDINGTGIAFLGSSGVGKSTMCNIIESEKATVIADDRFILDLSGNLICAGTPWNIKNQHYCKNLCSNLKKVYVLSHGSNQINEIGDSYNDMMQALFPAMLFPPFMSPDEVLVNKARYMKLIRKSCKIYTFAFKPDDSAIPYITAI